MKALFNLLFLLISGHAIADGIFGVNENTTRKDLENKGIILKQINDNEYLSKSAPTSNKNFGAYKYSFNKSNNKICNIAGFTEQIKSDRYGKEAKDKIDSIQEALKIKYGQPIFINELGKSKNEDWIDILENEPKANIYTYLWNKNTQLNNNNGVNLIILYPFQSGNKTVIRLDYYFEQCDDKEIVDSTGL